MTVPTEKSLQAIRDAYAEHIGWTGRPPMTEAAVQLAAELAEILTGPTSGRNAMILAVCAAREPNALAEAMNLAAIRYYQNIQTAEKVKS